MWNSALLSESKTIWVLLTYQRFVLTLESQSVSLRSKWHKHEACNIHPSVRLLVLTALAKWSSQEDRCGAARLILFTVGRHRVRTDIRAALLTHAIHRKGRTCHYRWVTQKKQSPHAVQGVYNCIWAISNPDKEHMQLWQRPCWWDGKQGWASPRTRPGPAAKPAEVLRRGSARSTGGFINSLSPQNKRRSAGPTVTFSRDTLTGSVWKHADTLWAGTAWYSTQIWADVIDKRRTGVLLFRYLRSQGFKKLGLD